MIGGGSLRHWERESPKGYKTEVFLLVFLNEMISLLLSGTYEYIPEYFGKVLIYVDTLHQSEASKFSLSFWAALPLGGFKC